MQQDHFYLAISGGNTPKVIFEQLIQTGSLSETDWNKVHFFWVDERLVPTASSESNYGNAMHYLGNLPSAFYPMYDESLGAAASLSRYREQIQKIPHENGFPVFDLILLGMGDDGHTASLFPGTEGLNENKAAVFINEVKQLNTSRMTLSFPVLLQAENCFILLNGSRKLEILQEMLVENKAYPIERIFESAHSKTWIYCK